MSSKGSYLASALKKARMKAGLSQRQLALKAEVSRPTITALEAGAHENVQTSTLARLAAALNVAPSELLGPIDQDALLELENFLRSPIAEMLKVNQQEREILRSMQNEWKAGKPSHEAFYHLVEAIRHCR